MHTRTEDLLRIRDREPIDAAARERILADPDSAREVDRLGRVREQLRELPELAPPPGVWERIEARTRAGARTRGAVLWRGSAGAGIAAGVAAAALWFAGWQPESSEPESLPAATVAAPATQAGSQRPVLPPVYASLVQESERLERLLAALPAQRSLMSASTASTIAGLEDRIAWLDEQLTVAAARGAEPQQRQALWSERVDMMNALVHLRYAQSQPFGF